MNKKTSRKKRIGVYIRFSGNKRVHISGYDEQLAVIKEYITNHRGWEVSDIFSDEVYSDSHEGDNNLDGFNLMMAACLDKKLSHIVTWSFALFGKNMLDTVQCIKKLKEHGIGIYFINEDIDMLDSESDMFISILSAMAEEEAQMLSDRTKWRVQKSFQQGRVHCPTTYFLGYDTDESGDMIINEEQAKVVRRIFSEFLERKGTPTIAKGLSEEGVKTARGNTNWTSNAVYKILKQEKYCGAVRTQKTVTLDPISHKRVRNKNIEAQYLIKNNHPSIISEDIFLAVQKEFERRQNMRCDSEGNHSMTYSGKTPLSGKIFCGECGRPVVRRRLTSTNSGGKYHFTAWQCRMPAGKDKGVKNCKAQYVWEVELEKAFMRALFKVKEDVGLVVSEGQKVINQCALSTEEKNMLLDFDEKMLKLALRISDMAAKASSGYEPVYENSLQQLIQEQENIQRKHAELNGKRLEHLNTKEQLEDMLRSLDEADASSGSDSFQGDLFIKAIDKVILYNNQKVEFHFKFGIRKIENAQRVSNVGQAE